MGFLAKLTGAFDAVKAGLDGEITKIKSRDQVNATLAIIALVAGADGDIEKEEIKAGIDFVSKSDLFKAFDRASLAATLDGYYAKATQALVKHDLFDVIRKVKGTDGARSVVKVGLVIANADGDFEEEEREVLREVVADTLGLSLADFKGLS